MFTGIIQAKGKVRTISPVSLTIALDDFPWEDPIRIGESIAVNGCCLTVVSAERVIRFDLSEETWQRTSFGSLVAGSTVNLERALLPSDRMGGHFVQGHVDGLGELISREGETFRFRVPEVAERYILDKGSIAIDGISLTVVKPEGREFSVAVIPHTLEATNLGEMEPGSKVNLELDLLAKYVEKLVRREQGY